jgi:hypothetical protein
MSKKENPDLLINIFTKEREKNVVNQYNAGWLWLGMGMKSLHVGGQQT